MAAADTVMQLVVAERAGGTEPVIDVTSGPATLDTSYVVQGSATGTAAIRSSAAAGLELLGTVALATRGPAVVISGGTANLIARSTLATIEENASGVEVTSANGSTARKKLTVDSSVILGGPGNAAVYGHSLPGSVGGAPAPSTAGGIDVLVRHSTLLGGKGVIAHAEANHSALDAEHGDVIFDVHSSIVHGESRTVNSAPVPLVFAGNVAEVKFTNSDAPPAPDFPAVTRDGATGFTPAGQIFRAGSFSQRADSPLIDKGGAVDPAESQKDVEGDARSVDGNNDGIAASDIGADEFVNKAPTASFAATNPNPKQGELIGFISVSTDPEENAGGGLTEFRWDFGDGTKETTTVPAVAHTYANRGPYTVTLTTVDRQGSTASESIVVTVRDGIAPKAAIALPESGRTYRLNPKKRKNAKRRPAGLPLGAIGSAIDESGIAKAEVALTLTKRDPVKKKRKSSKRRKKRTSKSQSTCEQFMGTRFSKAGCAKLEWIEVSVIGNGWTFATPRGLRIPAGRYQMRLRAIDGAGNASAPPKVSDGTLVGFRVK
jgi:PKD repeat protein